MPMSEAVSSARVPGRSVWRKPSRIAERELVAGVHASSEEVRALRAHPRVPIDVVRIRAAPRGHQVVLALERRLGRIPVADRPLQPAQELLRQMQEPLAFDGRIADRRADPHVVAEELEPRQQVAPRPCLVHRRKGRRVRDVVFGRCPSSGRGIRANGPSGSPP